MFQSWDDASMDDQTVEPMTQTGLSWRNPPAFVRIAIVAGVYGGLGVMGGLYLNFLPRLRVDSTLAALVGAVVAAPIGAWIETSAGESAAEGEGLNG